jgi:hypothetical protein
MAERKTALRRCLLARLRRRQYGRDFVADPGRGSRGGLNGGLAFHARP